VKVLSLLIRALVPSPGVAGAPLCKYYPTCSEYSALAYRELGVIRGTLLTVWRLLRCNPWSRGGVDYPPAGSARRARAAGHAHGDPGGLPGRPRP